MKFAYIFFNGKLLGNVEYFKNFFMQNIGDIFCADGGANLCYELNLIPNEIFVFDRLLNSKFFSILNSISFSFKKYKLSYLNIKLIFVSS